MTDEIAQKRTLGEENRQTASVYRLIQEPYDRLIRPVALRLFGRRLSVVNGVAMRRQAVTDYSRVIDLKSPMYDLIRDQVEPGDHVVDIAAGRGGFAVKAAMNGATVETYEAAENMAEWAQETIAWNSMNHRVTLHHALISGTATELYGPTGKADLISPGNLPEMDGLILDCEGAELGIIAGLTDENRPQYIIVETHPSVDEPAPTDSVSDILEATGYNVETKLEMVLDDKHALLAREVARSC